MNYLIEKINLPSLVLMIISFMYLEEDKVYFVFFFFWAALYLVVKRMNIIVFFLQFSLSILFFVFYQNIVKFTVIPFNNFIEDIVNFDLRTEIIGFVENNHSDETSSFLKILIFNERDEGGKQFIKLLSEFSISYLVVISGFHLILIPTILNKLIRNKKVNTTICISLMLFICYLANFGFSVFRAFLFYIGKSLRISTVNCFYFSLIIILLISPRGIYSYSLQMSYIATFGVYLSSKIEIKNKIFKTAFISVIVNLFLIIYLSDFGTSLSIWFWLFSIIYTPVFSVIYIFSLFFCWFPFLDILFDSMIFLLNTMLNFNKVINVSVQLSSLGSFINVVYFITLFSVIYLLQLKLKSKDQSDLYFISRKINQ